VRDFRTKANLSSAFCDGNLPYMADAQLARYYNEFDEDSRLTTAFGQLEFARAMELLLRYLPPPPALVLDIGGGTGRYSEALGQRGYETHLLDPIEKHVERAKLRAGVVNAAVGDARRLDWPDRFADAVLLLGPPYHLTEQSDRRTALREVRRVLKPGGVLAAAGISRFASLLDGLVRGFTDDTDFQSILIRDVGSGDHRNTTGKIDYFTHAHFHLLTELTNEVLGAGFVDAEVFSIEGLAWLAADLRES
jgi:ubiquinone/menaquinone biosynthesis C-methylase UbiE